MSTNVPINLKILIIGDSGVGKTSLARRFTDDTFDPNTSVTIGVDLIEKTITIQGQKVRLFIWDTAGSERFQAITPNFYRDAKGVIFVYEVITQETFVKLDRWLNEFEMHSSTPNAVKMLIGNKIDCQYREVTTDQALAWAHRNRTLYIETSAKTRKKVQDAFTELVEKILQNKDLMKNDMEKNIHLQNNTQNAGSTCVDLVGDSLSSLYNWFTNWSLTD